MNDSDYQLPEQITIEDLQNPKQITIEELLSDN